MKGHFYGLSLAVAVLLSVAGCGSTHVDVGSYRIVTQKGGVLGFGCQPRTEFYAVDRSGSAEATTYLGTCGTPRFVSEQMGYPADPSCFAVAEDGQSLVFFHRPRWCGAGEKAQEKTGGVYLHVASRGEELLYSERQVGQVWSRRPIGPHEIRVTWSSADTSRSGAVCSQHLIIGADGSERPEGEPTTVHGCRGGGARADTSSTSRPQ